MKKVNTIKRGLPADAKASAFAGGQALVALLIFVMMGLAIAVSASFIVASNSLAATDVQEGNIARQMADSGIETALLGILRNGDSYVPVPITNLNGGTVAITVTTNGSTKTIDSTATNGNYIKKVEVVVTYSNNVLTEVSWKEKNN